MEHYQIPFPSLLQFLRFFRESTQRNKSTKLPLAEARGQGVPRRRLIFFVKIIQHRNASGTQKYRVPSPSSAKSTHDENRAQLCSRGNRIAATYLASRQIILDIFQSCCKAVAKNLYYFIYSFFFFFFLFRNIIDFVLHSTYMSIVVEFEGYPSL